jgi:DNA helicase IV
MSTADPVLTAEREHLDLAERCLSQMRDSAAGIADYGVDELTSHALGKMRAQRLEHLAADPDAPPFFGRTDRDHEDRPEPEVLHIGRRHVRDSKGDPVVIDWRAPIARGFYRATATDRQGIRLRRRFGFKKLPPSEARGASRVALTSYEDEHLDLGEALGLESELLREEIERPRVGPMRDIVATIQPDQDDLVRADLDTSMAIQGAPGTGKTAVGLHRAAFLLYTYPERLKRTGVLVVGPNQAFLHYIAQVLPSLGEGGIQQATVAELIKWQARTDESADVATLKGDARMADVLRRAVLSHIAKPSEDGVLIIIGTKRYRVSGHHLRRYVDDLRRAFVAGAIKWDAARDRLRMQVAEDVRRQREDSGGAPSDAETNKVARNQAVKQFVDEVWPAVDAPGLLSRLYADPDLLARCAPNLEPDERTLLHREPARTVKATRWTPADLALLDELDGLISPADQFVHAVIDEAQDLSPMQCRGIARRCPIGSVTVLGDLAQATTPWAPGDWTVTLEHLGQPAARVRPLTAGYRVPAEVLDVANLLLPHIAVGVPPATSVRSHPDTLRWGRRADLLDQLRDCLTEEGSVGVIVPDAEVTGTLKALRDNGIQADTLDTETDARTSVVRATEAKGLEFDFVILLEPEAIVAGEAGRTAGLRRLYVVMTRAVSRLVVLHDTPLPDEMSRQ